jgi:hypothetical protein
MIWRFRQGIHKISIRFISERGSNMSDQPYAYPFDPTGTAISNKVPPEQHIINPPDYSEYYFIVPKVGPFFENGLVVTHFPSGLVLENGKDFVLGHKFSSASKATGKSLWGSISFYDKTLSGSVEIKYNTIGGVWTIDEHKVLEILSNVINNPRITTWEQVVDLPINFPVIDHDWNLDDLVGASEVVDAINRVTAGILDAAATDGEGGGSSVGSHVLDFNNPHGTTKKQIGLEFTPNLPLARAEHLNDPDSVNALVSPKGVRDILAVTINLALNSHVNNKDNVHEVTAEQVGLGNLSNFTIATPEEAVAGISNETYITPSGALILIVDKAINPLNNHINDESNPHNVTAEQVGLGDLVNLKLATDDEVISMDSNAYITSSNLQLFYNEYISNINAHLTNENNPHNVTSNDVGLSEVSNLGIVHVPTTENKTSELFYVSPRYVNTLLEDKSVEINDSVITLLDTYKPSTATNSELLEGLTVNEIVGIVAISTVAAIEESEARTAVVIQTEVTTLNEQLDNFLTEDVIVTGFNSISVELDVYSWELSGKSRFNLTTVNLQTFTPTDVIDVTSHNGLPVYLLAESIVANDLINDIYTEALPTGKNFIKITSINSILLIQTEFNEIYISQNNGVIWELIGQLDGKVINIFLDVNELTIITELSLYVFDLDIQVLTPRLNISPAVISDVISYQLGYISISQSTLSFIDPINLTSNVLYTSEDSVFIRGFYFKLDHFVLSLSNNTLIKLDNFSFDVTDTTKTDINGKFIDVNYRLLFNDNNISVSYLQYNVWKNSLFDLETIKTVESNGSTAIVVTSQNVYATV